MFVTVRASQDELTAEQVEAMEEWNIAVENGNFELAQRIVDNLHDDELFQAIMGSKMQQANDAKQQKELEEAEASAMKESQELARRQGIDPASVPEYSSTACAHNEPPPRDMWGSE